MFTAEFKVKDNGTFAYFNQIPVKIENIGKRNLWNLAQYGASAMIESAFEAGIKPWHNILQTYGKGIEPRKIKSGTYAVFMPWYGKRLDEWGGGYVALKRGRTITKWAREKGIKSKVIWVKPHPFIDMGFNKMLMRTDLIVQKMANEIVGG